MKKEMEKTPQAQKNTETSTTELTDGQLEVVSGGVLTSAGKENV